MTNDMFDTDISGAIQNVLGQANILAGVKPKSVEIFNGKNGGTYEGIVCDVLIIDGTAPDAGYQPGMVLRDVSLSGAWLVPLLKRSLAAGKGRVFRCTMGKNPKGTDSVKPVEPTDAEIQTAVSMWGLFDTAPGATMPFQTGVAVPSPAPPYGGSPSPGAAPAAPMAMSPNPFTLPAAPGAPPAAAFQPPTPPAPPAPAGPPPPPPAAPAWQISPDGLWKLNPATNQWESNAPATNPFANPNF